MACEMGNWRTSALPAANSPDVPFVFLGMRCYGSVAPHNPQKPHFIRY